MNKVVVRNLYICTTLWFQFGFWYCHKIRWDITRWKESVNFIYNNNNNSCIYKAPKSDMSL